MTKNKDLDDAVFLKARLEGNDQAKSAMIARPNISPTSASTVGNRMQKRVNKTLQKEIEKIFKKKKIRLVHAIQPIIDGLQAVKPDGSPDHNIRMRASERYLELIKKGDTPTKELDVKPDSPNQVNPDMLKAINKGDIKELQRIVFKDQ